MTNQYWVTVFRNHVAYKAQTTGSPHNFFGINLLVVKSPVRKNEWRVVEPITGEKIHLIDFPSKAVAIDEISNKLSIEDERNKLSACIRKLTDAQSVDHLPELMKGFIK